MSSAGRTVENDRSGFAAYAMLSVTVAVNVVARFWRGVLGCRRARPWLAVECVLVFVLAVQCSEAWAVSWGSGVEATLPANASSVPVVDISSVSCAASAGNCSAVGTYDDVSGGQQGLLVSESGGAWAAGVEAPLPANAGSQPGVNFGPNPCTATGDCSRGVSCASAGECSAVGDYTDNSGHQEGLLLTESMGTWAAGVEVALPANAGSSPQVNIVSVSCASAGECSAVGDYTDSSGHQQGLLLTQSGGSWATGAEASLPAGAASDPNVYLSSVSCASAGNCSAVGIYTDGLGRRQGLLLAQSAGSWAQGVEATMPANGGSDPLVEINAVSCASVGDCSAVGLYVDSSSNDQGVLLNETGGTWAQGVEAIPPASAFNVNLGSVSCASPGDCSAAGYQDYSTGTPGALLVDETAGMWAQGVEAISPGAVESINSVSCAAAGDCAAVGSYGDSFGSQGLLLSESGGTWSRGVKATPPANANVQGAVLRSVSCASSGSCSAVGYYLDSSLNQQGMLIGTVAGSTTPTLTVSLGSSGSGILTGQGSVSSSPAGISCPGTCQAQFAPGTAVTLTATPDSLPTPNAHYTFDGWSGGGCSGTGTCTVTMSSDQSVTATFGVAVGAIPPAGSSISIVPASRQCSEPCEGRFGATVSDPSGNAVHFARVSFSIAHTDGTPAPEVSSVSGRDQLTDVDGTTLDVEHTTTVTDYTVTASITDSAGTTHTASALWHVHPTTIGKLIGRFPVISAIIGRPLYASAYTGGSAVFAAAVFDAYGNQYKFGLPVTAGISKGPDRGWQATQTIDDFSSDCEVLLLPPCGVFADDQNVLDNAAIFDVTNGGTAGSDQVVLTAKDASGVTYYADFQTQSPELDFVSPRMPLPSNSKDHIGIETFLNVAGAALACAPLLAPEVGWADAVECFGAVSGAVSNQIAILDPPDVVHHARVALPRPIPHGAPSRRLLCRHRVTDCAVLVSLARQYADRVADVASVEEALAITANRYSGSISTHDFHAALGQQAALYVYLQRMATAITRRTGAGRALAAALVRDHLDARVSSAKFRAALRALVELKDVPYGTVTRLIKDRLATDRAGVAALVAQAARHVHGVPRMLSGILSGSVPGLRSLSDQSRRITVYEARALVALLAGQHAITARAHNTLDNDLARLEPPTSCTTSGRRLNDWRRLTHDVMRVSRRTVAALLTDATDPLRAIASGSSGRIPGCKPRSTQP